MQFELTEDEFIVIGVILLPYTMMMIQYLYYASKVNERTEGHIRML